MKKPIEFIVAHEDGTWDTHVEMVDVPDEKRELPFLEKWVIDNLTPRTEFRKAAYIGVYSMDMEADDPRVEALLEEYICADCVEAEVTPDLCEHPPHLEEP